MSTTLTRERSSLSLVTEIAVFHIFIVVVTRVLGMITIVVMTKIVCIVGKARISAISIVLTARPELWLLL